MTCRNCIYCTTQNRMAYCSLYSIFVNKYKYCCNEIKTVEDRRKANVLNLQYAR